MEGEDVDTELVLLLHVVRERESGICREEAVGERRQGGRGMERGRQRNGEGEAEEWRGGGRGMERWR